MTNFEKHIRDNKELFNEHKADRSKLWTNIESQLDKPDSEVKTIKLWQTRAFKVAASIIFALGLFSIISIGFNADNQQNSLALSPWKNN